MSDNSTHAYLQNRELSWLAFNSRVLDQGADANNPLLERLNFVSIFWSNLQEFFMVRVGSLTDLSLLKKTMVDDKTQMTPAQQIKAIHEACHRLYPKYARIYEDLRQSLAEKGIRQLLPEELSEEQRYYLQTYGRDAILPLLAPQIVSALHPFPHLENGALYTIARLASRNPEEEKGGKAGAKDATFGIVPNPKQCPRIIPLPAPAGSFDFILLEHAISLLLEEVFSMYVVKRSRVICVTRNADLNLEEGVDEEADYREYISKILKRRSRLSPVRLECDEPLSKTLQDFLLPRLGLDASQVYVSKVPLDMGFVQDLKQHVKQRLSEKKVRKLSFRPFSPAWPVAFDRNRSLIQQALKNEILVSYPYENMDAFLQLLREAASDPQVTSIKITLYRLASQSRLVEALIAAAEAGKEVTALFELRARFDENNNIEWSQRCEQAGIRVVYGFRDLKVHSKICLISRREGRSVQHIVQLGTGNYNEKTACLYTDYAFITSNSVFVEDAIEFFRNIDLETVADTYKVIQVAPVQIKRMILRGIDEQIQRAGEGKACGLLFKTNAVTDRQIIDKLVEASQAGVPITLFVRGICCILPSVKGYTDTIRVVSVVGRLLEHTRVFVFGPRDDCRLFLSSADLMTRNMDRRVEIAWPILDAGIKERILGQMDLYLSDTLHLRELKKDGSFALPASQSKKKNRPAAMDAQQVLIEKAHQDEAEYALKKAGQHDEPEGPVQEKRKGISRLRSLFTD